FCSLSGAHDQQRWVPLGPQWSIFNGLAVDGGGTIYGYRWEGGIIRSTDRGRNWSVVSAMGVASLVAGGRDTVYVIDHSNALYRSVDRGDSWEPLTVDDGQPVYSLAIGQRGEVIVAAGQSCTQTSMGTVCHSP